MYDSNSSLYQYVNDYKDYLEEKGLEVKEARLMTLEESSILKEADQAAWNATSYFLGTSNSSGTIYAVHANGNLTTVSYTFDYYFGVRPIIIF